MQRSAALDINEHVSIGGGFSGSPTGGRIFVRLVPKAERELSQDEIKRYSRPLIMP